MERWETFHRKTQVSSCESGATRIAANSASFIVQKASFEGNCMSSSESACISGSSSLITINEPQCSDKSDSESVSEYSEEVGCRFLILNLPP